MFVTLKMQDSVYRKVSIMRGETFALLPRLIFYDRRAQHDVSTQRRGRHVLGAVIMAVIKGQHVSRIILAAKALVQAATLGLIDNTQYNFSVLSQPRFYPFPKHCSPGNAFSMSCVLYSQFKLYPSACACAGNVRFAGLVFRIFHTHSRFFAPADGAPHLLHQNG